MQAQQPARRDPRVDEVVGQVGPPLIEAGAVHDVISRRLRDIEQIAVGVVLVLLAPGIAPVVEDLAAEQMAADTPGVPVTARHHHLLAHLHRVEIDDLEGDVIDLGFKARCDEQGVMVRRLGAAIEPHEGAHRRAVGEAHHVRRDEAESIHVPARRNIEVRGLQDHVSELDHLRRLQLRALGVVDPDRQVRRVVGNRVAQRQRLARREAEQHFHENALGVPQSNDRSAARPFRRLDRLAKGVGEPLKIRKRRHGQAEPDEAGLRAQSRPIDVGVAPRAAHEELSFGLGDADEAEVGEIGLRLSEIRPFEADEQERVRANERRWASGQDDASRADLRGCALKHGGLQGTKVRLREEKAAPDERRQTG